jgi:predicted DNA-binding protein with PD1-like motif
MRAAQTDPGRTFTVALDHGEDFHQGLAEFCARHHVRSGSVTFLGGLRQARLVGTCGPLAEPDQPLWDEVTVDHLEALGHGTLAWNTETDAPAPHIHLTAGLKADSAHARTSHLLGATVQFICELTVVEYSDIDGRPALQRRTTTALPGVPLLHFGSGR